MDYYERELKEKGIINFIKDKSKSISQILHYGISSSDIREFEADGLIEVNGLTVTLSESERAKYTKRHSPAKKFAKATSRVHFDRGEYKPKPSVHQDRMDYVKSIKSGEEYERTGS